MILLNKVTMKLMKTWKDESSFGHSFFILDSKQFDPKNKVTIAKTLWYHCYLSFKCQCGIDNSINNMYGVTTPSPQRERPENRRCRASWCLGGWGKPEKNPIPWFVSVVFRPPGFDRFRCGATLLNRQLIMVMMIILIWWGGGGEVVVIKI